MNITTHVKLHSWQLAAIEGNTRATARASIAAAKAGQQTVAQVATLRAELAQDFQELNSAVRGIEEQNREIASLHKEGIELQQEVLRREDFQNRMEELIYQFQKLLKKIDDPKSDFPVSTRYYLAVGILETVRDQQLSTVLIKGRDNKAAFEECTERASAIYKELQNHAEVKQALEWAAAQEEKQRAEEQKRRAEEQKQSIKARIRDLKETISEPTFKKWLEKSFGVGLAGLWLLALWASITFFCLGLVGGSITFVLLGVLVAGLAAVPYYYYRSNKECIAHELNAGTYAEIERLKAELAQLGGNQDDDQPATPKPREFTPSNEFIPSGIPVSSAKHPLTIRFRCPACKKTLKAPADKAGAKATCRWCMAALQIPSR